MKILLETKKNGVSEQVFHGMRQMILDQEYKPGSKLPSEQALCQAFGVSRVTVRSALLRLNAQGLIETRLGDGSYVKKLDLSTNFSNIIPIIYLEEDFENILEFRMEVESGACAIAARKATKKDVLRLRRILKRMQAMQNDLDALALEDLEFHYTIAQISRNNLIIKTYEVLRDVYTSHMKRMVKKMGGDWGVYYHDKIVSAIENQDAASAREVMFEHIYKNVEFLKL